MKITKHEQRTRETRDLLLKAAEKIFVRDGYEKADLAEIAELAGRTKGAIYGQFKSKEEIFLALVEANALRRRSAMRVLLERSSSTEENVRILRQYLVSLASDNTWSLLILEFKLYTIRHPNARERLSEVYRRILPENEEAEYTNRLGKPEQTIGSLSRTKAVHASFTILHALQLEKTFDPALFEAADVEHIAAIVFDKLFGID
ncbi:TetR/AcrR family transcriptional regulator [Silvibacterium acidisoli]|uniref:TetR/AcrR family transcriptional regulator n=1 Tax=Acidobacteriaceae bacterium ZG23-2 TaxID=2883246 RepID=UPI00406BF9EA